MELRQSVLQCPLADALCCCIAGDYMVIGTTGGVIGWAVVVLQHDTVKLTSVMDSILVAQHGGAVDCVVASPSSKRIACFTDADIVRVFELDVPTQRWKPVATVSLPDGCEYTNRSTAHQWLDEGHLAVGCFNGTVVCCDVAAQSSWVLYEDTSPIVQLFYSIDGKCLVLSTLARSACTPLEVGLLAAYRAGECVLTPQQIGQKPRDEGCFGACYSEVTSKVYAARHNARVFEADKSSGGVMKTYKVTDDTPLGLLRPLGFPVADGTTGSEEGASGGVALWSEGATFCAVVLLSTQTTSEAVWHCVLDGDDEVVLATCGTESHQFVLTSKARILAVAVSPATPAVGSSAFREPTIATPATHRATAATSPGAMEDPKTATGAVLQAIHEEGPSAATVPPPPTSSPHAEQPSASDASGDPVGVATAIHTAATIEQDSSNLLVDGQPAVKQVKRKISVVKKVSIVKKRVPKPRDEVVVVDAQPNPDDEACTGTASDTAGHSPEHFLEKPQPSSDAVELSDQTVLSPPQANVTTSPAANDVEVTPPSQEESSPSPSLPGHQPGQSVALDCAQRYALLSQDANTRSFNDRQEERMAADDIGGSPFHNKSEGLIQPASQQPQATADVAHHTSMVAHVTTTATSAAAAAATVLTESDEPPEPGTKEPEEIVAFRNTLTKLYRTFCARQLDKKAQPQLLQEMLTLADETLVRLEDLVSRPDRHPSIAEGTRNFFESSDASTVILLMRAALDWVIHWPTIAPEDRCAKAGKLFRVLEAMNVMEDLELVDVCESIAKGLSNVADVGWLNYVSSVAVARLNRNSVLPRFVSDGSITSDPSTPTATLCNVERYLFSQDPQVLQELSFNPAPTCTTRQYFPYLFVALPTKALQVALSSYPTLNVRYLEWALEGPVQTVAVTALQKRGITAERPTSAELYQSLSEILLLLVQESPAVLYESSDCFPRVITIFLKRRMMLKEQPVSATFSEQTKLKRIHRLEDAVIQLLRNCTLNISIAHPSLRRIFCQYEFPAGVVEIRGIEETIRECVRDGRVDQLLPLFSVPNAVQESHWLNLFATSHAGNCLMDAVTLCLGVVHPPKRVRVLLRRSFPYIDTLDLVDDQLKTVLAKLSVLIDGQ